MKSKLGGVSSHHYTTAALLVAISSLLRGGSVSTHRPFTIAIRIISQRQQSDLLVRFRIDLVHVVRTQGPNGLYRSGAGMASPKATTLKTSVLDQGWDCMGEWAMYVIFFPMVTFGSSIGAAD